jgi:hypothetical protein
MTRQDRRVKVAVTAIENPRHSSAAGVLSLDRLSPAKIDAGMDVARR